MSASDTTHETEAAPAELVDPLGGLDLGGLMGGMFPGMAELLAEVNDPDRVTIDDLDESLSELHEKIDWLAVALFRALERVPAKFRPELTPYPASATTTED